MVCAKCKKPRRSDSPFCLKCGATWPPSLLQASVLQERKENTFKQPSKQMVDLLHALDEKPPKHGLGHS